MTFSTTDHEPTNDDIDQPTTTDETATTQTATGGKSGVPFPISESKLTVILSAIALGVSLILALAILVNKILSYTCKKDAKTVIQKPKNDEISKMNEFTNPTYTSPIHNPNFSEENDDSYAL
jgi:hypothetical protein